jgi:fatty-acyl-CoA synthase
LDHAALGVHGMTFFDGRGDAYRELRYQELRERAQSIARRLLALNVSKGERIAIVAETRPEFAMVFFACQYAGLVPVPMPATVSLGGKDSYLEQLTFLIDSSKSRAAFATEEFIDLLRGATSNLDLEFVGTLEEFDRVDPIQEALPVVHPDDVAYVQYTSGSTRVARGAVITQRAVMCNLEAIIRDGLGVTPDDRFFSWLPFYHDMGLVGKLLVPVAAQVPVAYLGTREFAMRPRLWLTLMDRTQATISFGPPFGYELCARRLRSGNGAKFKLDKWRVAGVGAEMIRPESLDAFVDAVQGSGFRRESFLPCYGMAEVGLAISFSKRGIGAAVDYVDRDRCVDERFAAEVPKLNRGRLAVREFVDCGAPLPGIQLQIRNHDGQRLVDREIGTIWVKTESVMQGYLDEPVATADVLTEDGWLNTGDLGYTVSGRLIVTGREKDIIIVNGRNFWPHDLEYVAERQRGVRTGDAMAFSLDNGAGEQAVMLIQCRECDPQRRDDLQQKIQSNIRAEFSIDCQVELVGAHALPRTSSGKPSRSKAKRNYIASIDSQGAHLLHAMSS